MKITHQTKHLFVFLSLSLALGIISPLAIQITENQENIPIQPLVATTTGKIVYTKEQINKYKSEREEMVKTELALHFLPNEQKVALAIIKQESSNNPRAKNYNCSYDSFGTINGTEKPVRSKSCKKGDENQAWSVDCGIIMFNRKGLECKEEDFDISSSIKKMYDLYQTRGWQPWVAYTSGRYKAFL